MRILALDQSLTSCGFAIWETGEAKPQCGVWPLADSLRWMDRGFVRLQQNIMALHRADAIDHLVYEEPIKRPTDKLEKLIGLYGLVAHIMSFCAATGVSRHSVSSSRWRKHFIPAVGSGTEDWKFLAVKRCRALGFDPENHDAAEACGILDYQLDVLGIRPPWSQAETLRAIG